MAESIAQEKQADARYVKLAAAATQSRPIWRAADGPHRLAKLTRDIVGDRLDILVASAGISKSATIEDTTIEDFDRLFAVNVRTPFFLVQQLLPILSKGSSIVLLASLAARERCRDDSSLCGNEGRY